MAYINKLGGGFQQDGCLYKPTSEIQWTNEHLWPSDRPQKQEDSEEVDQSTFGIDVVVIS